MTVTLIRHGQTFGNSLHRYIGITDEPLCPQGVAGVQAVGENTEVKTVYVTPLQRTGQTAGLLFPQARQISVPELQEMNFGIFENRNAQEMEQDLPFRAWVDSGCLSPCPGGETMGDFRRRVCQRFAQLVADSREDLTLVVHGGTIMAIMSQFALPYRDYYDWRLKNCRGYCCDVTSLQPLKLENVRPWKISE